MIKKIIYGIIIITFLTITLENNNSLSDDVLKSSISNKFRSFENKQRDIYRNPYETLSFFEINRNKKILEIIPGRGWYTEILSKYMKDSENYYVLMYGKPEIEILKKIQGDFLIFFKENKKNFGNFKNLYFDKNFNIANKDNFFDTVLTFRNSHNWLDKGKAEKVYQSLNKVLKKGGILGVVQHRNFDDSDKNFFKGYVKEQFLIELIEKQGFKLIDKSEINSNPKDKKNYDKGVWALPPRLADGFKDKYLKIGESDRMTLKFKKQ